MPTYKRPGVFIEETLTPLASSGSSATQAIAAFVGTAATGPAVPTPITSWRQYASLYGNFGDGTSLLPHAVYQYFANGGSRCWVVRAIPSDATAATITLNDIEATPAPILTVTSRLPGAGGNQTYITISPSTITPGRFDMIVKIGDTSLNSVTDRYLDVSLNPVDPRYLIAMVNSATSGSQVISVSTPLTAPWTIANTPSAQADTPLTGGTAGTTANLSLAAAAQLLDTATSDLINLNLPGITDPTIINPLIAWAQNKGTVFMVLDAPKASATNAATVAAYVALTPTATGGTPYTSTSYAAMYAPWITVADPSSQAIGATRTVPPGGAVLGVYARTDAATGPQQAPAGVQSALVNVVAPEVRFADADLDTLNTAGVNILRTVPQSGVCVMGARTLQYGMPSRYIPIRRTLMYIEQLLLASTRFAVFAPNTPTLWQRLESVVIQQMQALMQIGVLQGATPAQSYFVQCDASNNPAAVVAQGQVTIDVGVALSAPSEFIVIRVAQLATGSTATSQV
jgi:phage tail sheath protein FI